MSVSACVITWNEEEMLPYQLKMFNKSKCINEICILDSNSTDSTQEILKKFVPAEGKVFKWDSVAFKGFGTQRNQCFEMATSEWILYPDADETFCDIDAVLVDLPTMPHINAITFPVYFMWGDRDHALAYSSNEFFGAGDRTTKMFRRGFASFSNKQNCHEWLCDKSGRHLFGISAHDILGVAGHPKYGHVHIRHYQYLKSHEARLEKGRQWDRTGMIAESARVGAHVHVNYWADGPTNVRAAIAQGQHLVKEIPACCKEKFLGD